MRYKQQRPTEATINTAQSTVDKQDNIDSVHQQWVNKQPSTLENQQWINKQLSTLLINSGSTTSTFNTVHQQWINNINIQHCASTVDQRSNNQHCASTHRCRLWQQMQSLKAAPTAFLRRSIWRPKLRFCGVPSGNGTLIPLLLFELELLKVPLQLLL